MATHMKSFLDIEQEQTPMGYGLLAAQFAILLVLATAFFLSILSSFIPTAAIILLIIG